MPKESKSKSFGWPFWLLAVGLIGFLYWLAQPTVIRAHQNIPLTEATSNLRQIGLALFEFDTEYGTYPSDATAAQVTKNNPGHGFDLSGKSSNALFRQLFAANITQSEQMFYAKISGAEKPDGNITAGKALEPHEVGFGYIPRLSTAGNPSRVLAFAPIIPGTDRFDPKPFEGFAVFLRIDNSVASVKIDENGHAIVDGQNVLSPKHPVWGESVEGLDIRYPESAPSSESSFLRKLFSE